MRAEGGAIPVSTPALTVAHSVNRCLSCHAHACRAVVVSDDGAVMCEACVRKALVALGPCTPTCQSLLTVLDRVADGLHERAPPYGNRGSDPIEHINDDHASQRYVSGGVLESVDER